MSTPQLPEGVCLLETQVAGHVYDGSDGSSGLMKDCASGCVLKSMGKPQCGEREVAFYETLRTSTDPIYKTLKTLVPVYHNVVKLKHHDREVAFLKMENITESFRRPCTIDIKIGKRTWDPVATLKKRMREDEKYAECKEKLGFCIPGIQVYSLHLDKLLQYGKEFGKQLQAEKVPEVLELFLNSNVGLYPPLVLEILSQLYKIRNWFTYQKVLKFYSSSILITYDSHILSMMLRDCKEYKSIFLHKPPYNEENYFKDAYSNYKYRYDLMLASEWIHVKMIDFAHVFPSDDGSSDTNYIFGLQNLITIFENILSKFSS